MTSRRQRGCCWKAEVRFGVGSCRCRSSPERGGGPAKLVEGHYRFPLTQRYTPRLGSRKSTTHSVRRSVNRLCPSTTLRVVPLPRWGRIAYVRFRSIPNFRHPGLDPGSAAALKSWIPDQVRDDDDEKILPVAQRWGGGPPPQAGVEGRQRCAKAPPSALPAATSPWLCHREKQLPQPVRPSVISNIAAYGWKEREAVIQSSMRTASTVRLRCERPQSGALRRESCHMTSSSMFRPTSWNRSWLPSGGV